MTPLDLRRLGTEAASEVRGALPRCTIPGLEVLPPAALADLIAAASAELARKLAQSQPQAHDSHPNATEPDHLLTPEEATAILGVSRRWLLRATRGLRFRRDFSRKTVRFEEPGLLRWIASRRA